MNLAVAIVQCLRFLGTRVLARLRSRTAGLAVSCLVLVLVLGFGLAFAESRGPTVLQRQNEAAPLGGVIAPPDPPQRGPLIARLRLLTHNVYGTSDDNCETRGKTFGLHLANAGSFRGQAFDIVGLQEYYEDHFLDPVCDHRPLLQAARSTGRYRNSSNTSLFRPRVSKRHNGGVGVLTLHPITKVDDWRWDNDTQSWPKAAEGFMFARIRIPGKELHIDTYVVHLNSGGENTSVRKGQLRQLASRIAAFSRRSGNPVIVMGDFNIGGPQPRTNPPGNPGYGDIISILRKPRDLWLNAHPQTDPAEGYTSGCGVYASNFNGCRGTERIDFIFHVTDPALTSSPYQLIVAEVARVRWAEPVHVSPLPIHYVSDHFGVDATIEIRRRPTP